MNYPIEKDFYIYCTKIINEMVHRGYNISKQSYNNWYNNMNIASNYATMIYDPNYIIFKGWHNKDYLRQCYYNLQEKYYRDGMTYPEWFAIDRQYNILMNEEEK